MNELKDCPFCGNDPIVIFRYRKKYLEIEIKCKKCRVRMINRFIKYKDDQEKCFGLSAEIWNNRVSN